MNSGTIMGMTLSAVISLGSVAVAFGQTPTPTLTPQDEPDFIVPARPTVSNPAEFQRPGVLQLEVGVNSSTSIQQDVPVALRFAISRRVLVEFDLDSPYSVRGPLGSRQTGWGDGQLGLQVVVQHEDRSRPGFAIAYYIKVPTASARRGLGTGKADHSLVGLVSKTVRKTTVDFNAIYLLAGRTLRNSHTSSGQGAFAVTQKLNKRFGIQGELSGSSRNDRQPGAMFGLGVATYQINRRMIIDGGVRMGLTPDAAHVGFVAGVTLGVANLYKHRH